MTRTALFLDEDGSVRTGLADAEVVELARARRGVLWVNIERTSAEDAAFLGEAFGFHPLTLEDALNARYHRPKVEDHGDYLFLTLHGIDHEATSDLVVTTELDLWVGEHFVVSASVTPVASLSTLVELAASEPAVLARGAPMLAHAIVDALVDGMLPTVERMEEVTDVVEETALERPEEEDLLAVIQRLRRSALRVQRIVAFEREVVLAVSRGRYALLSDGVGPYFADIADHLARIEDIVHSVRERADHAVTTYLSALSVRQNETMRALAVVAAIFLPLTLIAGIYGMNFEHMPELDEPWAYPAVLAAMLVVAAGIVWWFWLRGWIRERRRRVAERLSFRVEPAAVRDMLLGGTGAIGTLLSEAGRIPGAVFDASRLRRRP